MANFFKKYWGRYMLIGTSSNYSTEENAKISVMNSVCVFAIIGCIMSSLLRIGGGYEWGILLRPLGIGAFLLLLLLFHYFKKHRLGWQIGIVGFLLAITFAATQRPVLYINYLIYGPVTFLIIYLFDKNKFIQNAYLLFIALNIIAFTALSNYNTDPKLTFSFFTSFIIILIVLIAKYFIISLSFSQTVKREKELAYAISLKDAALHANKDATVIITNEGQITDWNAHYLSMWDMSEVEVEQLNLTSLLNKVGSVVLNPQTIKNATRTILNNPIVCTFDRLYLKNGKIIESHSQPQILNGEVFGRVCNFRDVTLKIKTEKRIIESESRFRSFYEDSPLGVLILEDIKKPFRNVNQRLCDMLGYTQAEISKLELSDICADDYVEKHFDEYSKKIKNGVNNFKFTNKYRKKSGELFWGRVNVSTRKDAKEEILSVILMLENVNEKMLQEQKIEKLLTELKQLNEKLEQTVKLRTIDLRESNDELRRSNQDLEQFAYIASHDLQEPLRMVGNFVQLLERQYKNKIDEEGKEYIGFIVDGVSRMSKLIQNLLKYSRVGRKEAQLRTTKLDRIIEAKLFGLKQKIEETGAEVIIKDIPTNIYCEPDQIGMVFYNLITNALKFTKDSPKLEIGFQEKTADYLFYVKDNGIGIEQIYDTKVFEIFKRLHRREDYEGTGIGLALCKKIIARHGGRIWFESEINQGTIFYFTISKSLKNEKHVPFDTNLVS